MFLTEDERARLLSTLVGEVSNAEREALLSAVANAASASTVYPDAIQVGGSLN